MTGKQEEALRIAQAIWKKALHGDIMTTEKFLGELCTILLDDDPTPDRPEMGEFELWDANSGWDPCVASEKGIVHQNGCPIGNWKYFDNLIADGTWKWRPKQPDYMDGEDHIWVGGDCPVVRGNTAVYVGLRSGESETGLANEFSWDHENGQGDIVRFRVISDKPKLTDTDSRAGYREALEWVREQIVEAWCFRFEMSEAKALEAVDAKLKEYSDD